MSPVKPKLFQTLIKDNLIGFSWPYMLYFKCVMSICITMYVNSLITTYNSDEGKIGKLDVWWNCIIILSNFWWHCTMWPMSFYKVAFVSNFLPLFSKRFQKFPKVNKQINKLFSKLSSSHLKITLSLKQFVMTSF